MYIAAPAGTIDLLPDEVRMDRFVEKVFMDKCRLYGYSEIHTPVFEYSRLFKRGVGHVTDIIENELYTFTDKNGERLALRPEGTTAVARAVLQHGLSESLPAKLCYKITCYRQETPEEGRLREFHQVGAECYGSGDPRADCEAITLAYDSLCAMGVEKLVLNINSVGCDDCRIGYVGALTRYLLPFANSGELCPTCISRLSKNPVRILDCKQQSCRAISRAAPKPVDYLCADCREHYDEVRRQLAAQGIPFNEKPRLIRGLDYYNRTVFEFKGGSGGANGTVCGGGRYDNLCKRIGGEAAIPAVGFAIGEERAVLAMSEGRAQRLLPEAPSVYIISSDAALAAVLAAELRGGGIYAERDLFGKSEAEQRAAAESTGAKRFIYASDKGLRMVFADGKETELSDKNDIIKFIKEL